MKIINSEFLYTNFEDFKLDDVAGEISIKTTGMIHKPEGKYGKPNSMGFWVILKLKFITIQKNLKELKFK